MEQNGISDIEKGIIITNFLKEVYIPDLVGIGRGKSKRSGNYTWMIPEYKSSSNYIYKFTAIFDDNKHLINSISTSYFIRHSMLANLVIDYPVIDNGLVIVLDLKKALNEILEFSKDDDMSSLDISFSDDIYARCFKEMLKHILYSYKGLPSNIDIYSLQRSNKNRTFSIKKKKY